MDTIQNEHTKWSGVQRTIWLLVGIVGLVLMVALFVAAKSAHKICISPTFDLPLRGDDVPPEWPGNW